MTQRCCCNTQQTRAAATEQLGALFITGSPGELAPAGLGSKLVGPDDTGTVHLLALLLGEDPYFLL
jgi:hypothetical protein